LNGATEELLKNHPDIIAHRGEDMARQRNDALAGIGRNRRHYHWRILSDLVAKIIKKIVRTKIVAEFIAD